MIHPVGSGWCMGRCSARAHVAYQALRASRGAASWGSAGAGATAWRTCAATTGTWRCYWAGHGCCTSTATSSRQPPAPARPRASHRVPQPCCWQNSIAAPCCPPIESNGGFRPAAGLLACAERCQDYGTVCRGGVPQVFVVCGPPCRPRQNRCNLVALIRTGSSQLQVCCHAQGTVRIVFQPAEEGGAGGDKMIQEGPPPRPPAAAADREESSALRLPV